MPKLLFSPYIALGLPEDISINETVLATAYRRASKHCHSDVRRRLGVPCERWPTIAHLNDAKEYFRDLEQGKFDALTYSPGRFQGFPWTFDPTKKLGSANVYTRCDKTGFVDCTECYMTLRISDENEHLVSHERHRCRCCRSLIRLEKREYHYSSRHSDCTCFLEGSRVDHVALCHVCPFCSEYCPASDALIEHITSHHSCDCQDTAEQDHIWTHHMCCGIFHRDLARHLNLDHPCFCPISRETEKADHLISAHRCLPCRQAVADMRSHRAMHHKCRYCDDMHEESPHDHIERCHMCESCRVYHPSLDEHFELRHYCKYCNLEYSNSNDFDAHREETHLCKLCEISVRNLQSHMRTHCPCCKFVSKEFKILFHHIVSAHSFQTCECCPLFNSSNLYTELLEHIKQYHPWTVCPLCPDERLIHKSSIFDHLRASHCWEECSSNCVDPTDQYAQDHFRTHHGKQTCEECLESLYPSQLEDHLTHHHGHVRCFYCKGLNAKASHETHVERHHPRSCPDPDCSELVPADEMPQHGRAKHSWLTCPSCYHTMPENQLQHHLSTAHTKCKDCNKLYDAFEIDSHRAAVHGWEECCGSQWPPSSIASHQSDHRPIKCPYPNCDTECPEHEWLSHFRNIHSKTPCFTCGNDPNEENSVAHFFSHYNQSGSQGQLGELIDIKASGLSSPHDS